MKAIRITQLVVIVLLGVYLWIFHTVNQDVVYLPLLPSLRPAVVLLLAIVLTWLATSLPAQARIWRLRRKLKAAIEERDALTADFGPLHDYGQPDAPVIPDRIEIDPYETGSGAKRRGDDPTDYL